MKSGLKIFKKDFHGSQKSDSLIPSKVIQGRRKVANILEPQSAFQIFAFLPKYVG